MDAELSNFSKLTIQDSDEEDKKEEDLQAPSENSEQSNTASQRRVVKKKGTNSEAPSNTEPSSMSVQEETDGANTIHNRRILESAVGDELEEEIETESTVSTQNQAKGNEATVGLVYSEEMMNHKKFDDSHPERPERIQSIYEHLSAKKLLAKVKNIEFSEAEIDHLKLVHSGEIIERVLNSKTIKEGENTQWFDEDNYESTQTGRCALLAAGGAVEGMRTILDSSSLITKVFALVRPPGHHAFPCSPAGFCFFNNVAVAVKVAQKELGVKRVCIFDWDVHHGDGTQEIFLKDESVLYVSLHRYDYSKFYPHKEDAAPCCVGEGKAKGYNVNIGWNHKSISETSTIGDKEYKLACNELLHGIIQEFEPEVIVVSAGFDAAKGDPLGKMQVTPNGYSYMTSMLKSICSRILVVLEGGYNLKSISKSAEATVKTLLKDSNQFIPESVDLDELKPSVVNSLRRTAEAHKPYWTAAKRFIELVDKL
mmetsp:Transcript_7600/g.8584  ORF Transcript_7600/g.8584 Transcript_7600/m.8584 type:complete len:482 (-) Transcript_7600:29-1474(-)|eukprot:CAMPEP_0168330794 /NCGR_PEP_ID=MMETSP0213-20121227/7954_1 /TAXON_ID=151035 /ORGANISM="Euplotes harpa, Strain FSP1.4" /LENGTH=481 /DNA_ID=CAMNT_0008334455 /DNA_START=13 /DNA_END=1458 /DNA_ORIENTATION=+